METIDMSQVAGFKAVDAEGNELGVVSMSELTASISEQVLQTIAMRNQANTLEQPALMSTLATGNDAYENELQQVSDANWVRALLADGTPVLWNKSDLASVVGGLIGTASYDKNGLAPRYGGPMFLNIEVNQEVVFNIGYCLVAIGISYSGNIGVYAIDTGINELKSVLNIAVVNRGGSIIDGKLNLIQTGEYSFKIVNKDNVMRSASIGILRTR